MFSPASVTRNRVPGLSRLLLRKSSGNVSFPPAAIFTVVVMPEGSLGGKRPSRADTWQAGLTRRQGAGRVERIWQGDRFGSLTRLQFIVELLGALAYLPGMSQTLEKRVQELEHKLAELTNGVTARKPRKKDWQRTFGLSRDDDGFKEMVKLGRQYRQSLREKGNGAGS
jgi:hypothetical protein